jgi:hypothetical protein
MDLLYPQKLYSYQQEPPPDTWENIHEALDSGIANEFSHKLNEYALLPPEAVWDKVAAQLEPVKASTPIIPIRRRYQKKTWLASAAAAVFIMAVLTNLVLDKRNDPEQFHSQVLKRTTSPEIRQNTSSPAGKDISAEASTENLPLFKKNKEGLKPAARLFHFKAMPLQAASNLSLAGFGFPDLAIRTSQMTPDVPDEKYMIYIDSEGNAFKLPKKLYNNLVCPTNEPGCKEHLKQLQEKLAISATNSDFTGLLDMISNVKENQ